jgi:hypothetical protein
MNVEELVKACENENNKHILELTNDKILQTKVDIIAELPIEEEDKIHLGEKLEEYMYVDEIHELKSGSYLRWINISDSDNIFITNGAIFCEIVFTDFGTCLRMRNFRKRYFEIKMDDVILFQKLTEQEKILLYALSYISK